MIMKKKQLLTATLVIALGAAVAVNWYYTENPIDTSENTTVSQAVSTNLGDSVSVGGSAVSEQTTEKSVSVMAKGDFFTEQRMKRDETYGEIIDSIEDIAEKENLSDENAKQIESMLEKYSRNMKAQSDAESLITAKTGGDCIVVINDGACQVVLEKNTLNDTVILQITEIIEKNANISAKKLTIIEAK